MNEEESNGAGRSGKSQRPAPLGLIGRLSGAREQRILKAAHERIAREIEELTESAAGIPQKAPVEQALKNRRGLLPSKARALSPVALDALKISKPRPLIT